MYISNRSKVKSFLGILLAAAVVCSSFAGCGGGSSEAPESKSVITSKVESKPESKPESKSESKAEVSKEAPPIKLESSKEPSSKEEAPKVNKIDSINASLTDGLKVNLSWSASSGASGYEIYRMSDKSGSEYEKITSVKSGSESYTDDGVESGLKYYYQIRPYISKNNNKYYGEFTSAQIIVTLPAVSGLSVPTQNSSSISISWDKIANAAAYTVSRQDEDGNGEYISIATIQGADTTSYTDMGLKTGKLYKYKVEAYAAIDGENYYSQSAEIEAWTVPDKPEFTAEYKSSGKKLSLKWPSAKGAEGYAIYLSTSENEDFKEIGTTEENKFEYSIKKDNIYYVRVYAYCTINGEKKYSSCSTVKIECGNVPKVHGYTVGTTYIEISLEKQHMWFYKEGKLIVSTDVVTGYKNAHDTPTGLYYVINKASPARLVGETWDVWVNYWLGVTYDGIGIHDSTWRYGGYGGNIYTYDGSHGCINTPYDEVKKIYDNCEEKTPVVIY